MDNYVVVTNQPNRIATVHKADCWALGQHPSVTANSQRRFFNDGFPALAHAQDSMPSNYGLCGHCLHDMTQKIAGARR